ncbi:hypothetical protein HY635_01435 [Candidatus Uhrbacteria bacterium]|nr:hypothetical protein [Candidatus Uhrbacteria bacterium]
MLLVIGAILTAIGAAVLTVIVVRVMPRLVHLPSRPAPTRAERELRVKERLLLERLTRQMRGTAHAMSRGATATFRRWESGLQRGYRRLRLLAQEYVVSKTAPTAMTCEVHLTSAAEAINKESLEEAEEHFLACLKLDPKHRGAYLGLAALYQQRKEDALAEETLRFLRKLYPDDGEVAAYLADVLRSREKYGAALKELLVAIDQSPRNPRYLDFAIELAIMDRNARLAGRYLDQLREANPENQKLEELEERIAALNAGKAH